VSAVVLVVGIIADGVCVFLSYLPWYPGVLPVWMLDGDVVWTLRTLECSEYLDTVMNTAYTLQRTPGHSNERSEYSNEHPGERPSRYPEHIH
jgi:hypothetical protein